MGSNKVSSIAQHFCRCSEAQLVKIISIADEEVWNSRTFCKKIMQLEHTSGDGALQMHAQDVADIPRY